MLIAQLSDPHLRTGGVLYKGIVDSAATFRAAIRQVVQLRPRPDLVVLTGDLVDEGTAAEYAVAMDLLAALDLPFVAIPGNHDERAGFRQAFAGRAWLPAEGPIHVVAGDHGPVRVLGLDVTVPGEHHGMVDDAAATWLTAALAAEPERPTLLLLHQPPIMSGIPYLDEFRCFGEARLAEIVARFPAIVRIACGHVHRFMLADFAGRSLCTAPSTATAIALRLDPDARPASYLEPPGFLLHHWSGAGLVTHLVPIGSFPGPYDFF